MKPTHRLKFLNKATEEREEVGAVWKNKDGSITIVLNPKVVLTENKDELLTLFPVREVPTAIEVLEAAQPYRRKCCERDHNSDGNCDVHSAPGVLRKK